jgi:hypothetical protein
MSKKNAHPGKFEGEPAWAALVWSMQPNRTFYEGDLEVSVYSMLHDPELEKIMGEDFKHGDYLLMWENDAGFVYTRIVPVAELERIEDAEAEWAQDEDR